MAPTDFWQLALSPDDEAAQAARRGVADGHGKAVVLVPNNNWGRRLLTTYTSELESLGGTVLDYRTYEPSYYPSCQRRPTVPSALHCGCVVDQEESVGCCVPCVSG